MANWSGKRKEAVETLGDEFDRFQGEFDALRSRLGRLAGDSFREFSESPQKLADLRAALDGRLSTIERELDALTHDLRIRGGDAAGRLEASVKERPFTALAIAAGVGFVAARLLRRRRS